jgi:hypothetical protein
MLEHTDGECVVLPDPRERLKLLQKLLSSSLEGLSLNKEEDFEVGHSHHATFFILWTGLENTAHPIFAGFQVWIFFLG